MKELPLNMGGVALVDDEDYETLSKHKWYVNKNGRTIYAYRQTTVAPKTIKTVYMHVLVMQIHGLHIKGLDVDHIDHDGLNNTKANLRCISHMDNLGNRRDNASGYPGVGWHKSYNKWQSRVRIGSQLHHLGMFDTPLEAHEARQKFLKERGIA